MAQPQTVENIASRLCTEIQMLLSLDANSIKTDTVLSPLGIDSMKLVSLMLRIEQIYGVNLIKMGLKTDDLLSPRSLAAVIYRRQEP